MIPITRPNIGEEEKKAVLGVLESGMLAQGPKVKEFEQKLAESCGVNNAVAMNSGTAALHTALHVLGVSNEDEVITTPFTFISTANSILMQGAKPVFVDIDPKTFNIDPDAIKHKINEKTKAIITVDLYGQLCDYDKIIMIAKENNLKIIEDACQAINAKFNGKMAGSFGDIGCFSFYATKNICCGEGGAMVTNSDDFSKRAILFRQHGMSGLGKYDYNDVGYNYRMTDISAAILIEQLKKINNFTQKRKHIANFYNNELKEVEGIKIPFVVDEGSHAYHQYTIKVDGFRLSRDELIEHLKIKGIGCGLYYPKPLHLCENFKKLGYQKGDFPVAEEISTQVLSLPIYPGLEESDLNKVIKAIKEVA